MLILIFLTLFYLTSCLGYSISNSEYQALNSLYNSTLGEDWLWNNPYSFYGIPWNFANSSSDPCNYNQPWQGVTCDCVSTSCNIVRLNLSSHNLIGTLPSEMGNFTQLISLDLLNNSISGSIPSQLGFLRNLSEIFLGYNYLSSTIPESLSNLSQLEILALENNTLSGTISNNIGLLQNLTVLNLFSNYFNGSIPEVISNIKKLVFLNLGFNNIKDIIPESLGQLVSLKSLILEANFLNGTIPETLCKLINLEDLNLAYNRLVGTIPFDLGNLTSLITIDLNHNNLIGSLPSSIGNLSYLSYLHLYDNKINGTIPNELFACTHLKALNLYLNHISGIIPQDIRKLSNLEILQLQENNLKGSIPPALGYLADLKVLRINRNSLTNTIPTELCYLKSLEILYIDSNYLNGTIPSNIGNWTSLYTFNIFQNHLTGTIPKSISNMSSLITFEVFSNFLHGNIPKEIGSLSSLRFLQIFDNSFTGQLPDSFGNLKKLVFVEFSRNFFTGIIPLSLFNLPLLKSIDFSSNHFSGTLPSTPYFPKVRYFSVSNNHIGGKLPNTLGGDELQLLYVSNNSFSGNIPNSLLSSGKLTVFIASINCFTGSLPTSICSNSNLTQVVMDGLHSSSSCRKKVFPFDKDSGYFNFHGVHGTIPSCLFSFEKMKVLHLSGNNLHGSIPKEPTTGIFSLILANNQLTGTIPQFIWDSKIFYLDLSFNKFISTVDFRVINPLVINSTNPFHRLPFNHTLQFKNVSQTLYLKVNRLSGNLPQLKLPEIEKQNNQFSLNVLEGNMFDCTFDRSDLPESDPNRDSYQCGSDNTNISLYLWIAMFFIYFLILWLFGLTMNIFIFLKTLPAYVRENLELLYQLKTKVDIKNIDLIIHRHHSLNYMLLHISLWLCFVILPSYMILTHFYGTYTYQYAWVLSSAYLTNTTPAVTMLVLFCLLVMIIIYHLLSIGNIFDAYWKVIVRKRKTRTYQEFGKLLLFAILNVIIVLTINLIYVFSINNGYNVAVVNIISLAMSIFKLLWGKFMLLGIGREYIQRSWAFNVNPTTIIVLSIFNNVIAPYIAEGFVSSNCFLYVVAAATEANSRFFHITCHNEVVCSDSYYCRTLTLCPDDFDLFDTEIVADINYDPPFHYSYSCSSSLLSAFSSIFVYRYIFSAFFEPLFYLLLKHIQINYLRYFNLARQWKLLEDEMSFFQLITFWLPNLLKFEDRFEKYDTSSSTSSLFQYEHHDAIMYTLQATETALREEVNISEKIAVRVITDLTMLLSFGVLFPPLGIIVLISMIKDMLAEQFLIGKFLRVSLSNDFISRRFKDPLTHVIIEKFLTFISYLNQHLSSYDRLFWIGIWWGTWVSVWFWSFCLFDTLGNSVGPYNAIWIVFVMGFSPYWCLALVYFLLKGVNGFFSVLLFTTQNNNLKFRETEMTERKVSELNEEDEVEETPRPSLDIRQENDIEDNLSADNICDPPAETFIQENPLHSSS